MALETALNSQITDAVTQANVKTLGDAPAMAISNLYQIISQSLGLSAQNAVMAQQQSNIIHQASTTQGVNLIYAVDTAAVADATDKIIVATYGVAAVGINIPRIFNLVLVEPGKSFVRVIQSIGRGIRKAEDKDSVQIWDITSTCKFAKRHLTKRKQFYKEAKYNFTREKLEWMKIK